MPRRVAAQRIINCAPGHSRPGGLAAIQELDAILLTCTRPELHSSCFSSLSYM